MLSTFAVHRYLQTSASAMQHGEGADSESTPDPGREARIAAAVTDLTSLPGVATASATVTTETAATPSAERGAVGIDYSYDVSVIMNPEATPQQAAAVVLAMIKQVPDSQVNLELSSPAGDGHAASVVEYRHALDSVVSARTVTALSQAVATASAVPGVEQVAVTVPYTWNLQPGDLDVTFADDGRNHSGALRSALASTALSGVSWTTSK